MVYLVVSFACILFIGSYVYASEKEKETVSTSNELVFLSASELAEKIKSHQVTSLEVVNAYLDHFNKHNQKGEGVGSAFDFCERSVTKVNIRDCFIQEIILAYRFYL